MEDTRSDAGRAQDDAWAKFVDRVRAGHAPEFSEQLAAYHKIFDGRLATDGPPRAWTPAMGGAGSSPSPAPENGSNLDRWLAAEGLDDYKELRARSLEGKGEFWSGVLDRLGIVFDRQATVALERADLLDPGWFRDSRLNIVDSCFEQAPEHLAIVSGREGSAELVHTSYGDLEKLVNRVAAGLVAAGMEVGDRVALCMPMTVQCVAAYLGIVRAGCSAVSIADSFSAEEIDKRLRISNPRYIITVETLVRAGKSLALYDRVCRAGAPVAIVVRDDSAFNGVGERGPDDRTLREADLWWDDFLADGEPHLGVDAHFASSVGPPGRETTVLFSSGTTGTPKAIAWNHLTPVKAILDGHVHQDIREGDVVAWPTNIGWMMGPWLIFASLVNGASIALFDGSPSTEDFTKFVANARVTVLGVIPTLVRAWRDRDAMQDKRWPDVRVFSTTGEPSNVEDYLSLMSRTDYRAPVIEYIGGTELGGGYLAGVVTRPASPGTFNAPALGLDVVLQGDDGEEIDVGESGEVFLVPPAVGLSESLLNADHFDVYHEGCPLGRSGDPMRRHGDRIAKLGQGFYRADGRVDDVMNLGGIKVGSLELERVLNALPSVRECAAVGISPPEGGGQKLVVFVIAEPLADPLADPIALAEEMAAELASRVNPLFQILEVVPVDEFPRTASSKIMRRTLQSRYQRERG